MLALVQVGFATGTHELYQLPLSFLAPGELGDREAIQRKSEWVAVDAVADPELARELLRAIDDERTIETDEGTARFCRVGSGPRLRHDEAVRPMGVEQSNSSIVFADETVLKVFRRLEPGINPELEMLRFLTERDFQSIAPLQGYYEYDSRALQATLGVAQRFYSDAVGGWALALDRIGTDPAAFLILLGALGEVTAALHNALASDHADPRSRPRSPAPRRWRCWWRRSTRRSSACSCACPTTSGRAARRPWPGCPRADLPRRAQLGVGGRLIRTHGDYHLGQTLYVERRVAGHRLRGRAGAAAVRTPAEELAAARRRGDAAVVRLRRLGVGDPALRPRRRAISTAVPARRSWSDTST